MKTSNYYFDSASFGLDVSEFLGTSDPAMSVSDMAMQIDMAPSSCYRLIAGEVNPRLATVLDICNFCKLDPKNYFICN